MKRAVSNRESSRKLLTSDPETILQLMDEFSSEEDSGSEFEGYITDDDEVDSIHDAPTRFFQNKALQCDVSSTLHQSESSLVLLSQDEAPLLKAAQDQQAPAVHAHTRANASLFTANNLV